MVGGKNVCIINKKFRVQTQLQPMGVQHLVGGSTGPGYGTLCFDLQEKMEVAKTTHLSSGINDYVYIRWSFFSFSFQSYLYFNLN